MKVAPPKNPFSNPAITETYEDWYQTVGRRPDRLEKNLLKNLLDRFPSAYSIMEVGVGTGHFTRWFDTKGMNGFGLDISYSMLEAAKGFGSNRLIQGEATSLPIASNSIDIIAMITSLEFLPDPKSALIEAKRVARQGLILGVINQHSFLGLKYKRLGGEIWGVAQFYSPAKLKTMVLETLGAQVDIIWHTTLWQLIPFFLPLPWGGFIGMAVKWTE